ncbi:hypothetical protein B0G80_7541 [Paraburkholderia sp. BL6669N2]|nr:hypothetical protein B0G80_7541 [Paraburkholderia sp. BL6669N2]
MTQSQLADLFDRLGTPPAGQQLILNAMLQTPVRKVTSQRSKVIAFRTSQKMARHQAESRHVEFMVTVTEEQANHVLEYCAQPCEPMLSMDTASSYRFSFGSVSRDMPC